MKIKKFFFCVFGFLFTYFIIASVLNTTIYAAGAINQPYKYFVFHQERILYYDYSDFTEYILEEGIKVVEGPNDTIDTYSCMIIREVDNDNVLDYDDSEDGTYLFPGAWNYNNIKILTSNGIYALYLEDYNVIFNPANNQIIANNIDLSWFNQQILNPSSLDSLGNVVSSHSITNSFYFSNLKENMGVNDKGSCVYVALTSILGYYDIFVNDNIVSNEYNDMNFINTGTTKNSYNVTTCENSPGVSDEFHDFIIQEIGIKEKNLHNLNGSFGLSRDNGIEVLRSYLNEFTPFTGTDYIIGSLNHEDEIIQKLDNNIPVILGYNSWGYDVEIGSSNCLYNLFNYKHMVIAYGYEILDDGTVYYRCNMGWQGANETADIYVKSYDIIEGFYLQFNNILHICSNAYVNNISSNNQQPFCPTCGNYTNTQLNMDCWDDEINETHYLQASKSYIYPINIECPIQYMIKAKASDNLEITVYNSNWISVSTSIFSHINNYYEAFTCPLFNKGKYYIEIKYKSEDSSGNVQFTIYPYTNTVEDISSKQCVNVLPHLHENKNEFKICTRTEGLYLLELDAYVNGLSVNPNSSIVIKNSSGDVVAKYSNADIYLNASSVSGSNNILFYAEKWNYYYIYIEVAPYRYSSLNLNISRINEFLENTINVTSDYSQTITMPLGDSVNILSLDYAGSYEITLDYLGNQNSNLKFCVLKTNANNEFEHYATYSYSELCSSIIIDEDITQVKKLMLCVFNNETNGRLSINIDRDIDENHFTLITDKSYNQSGSEVHLNNGTLGGTIITRGFTRLCYLGDDAPNTESRLHYYWYSSNNNVATVSIYGTITAVGVGTATIQAVYKNDRSKIATLTIQVIEDTNNDTVYLQYGMDVRVSGTLSGTEVSSGMGAAINVSLNPTVTMHRGYTRLICIGDDSPNSSVQAFNWSVVNEPGNTGMVSVSEFGTIIAERSGTVVIEGTYKYNSRFKVRIIITVL